MKESRDAKLGRFLAGWIDYTISTIPEERREEYRRQFHEELNKISFQPRKKGEPPNPGCTWELIDLLDFDIDDPSVLAKTVKELLQKQYLQPTKYRTYTGITQNLFSP